MPEKIRTSPLLTLGKSWERALRAGTATRRQGKKPASSYTIRNYRKTLARLDAHLAQEGLPATLEGLTVEVLNAWLDQVAEETSSGNALHHFRNLTGFWKWVVETEEMVAYELNPMRRVLMPSPNETARPPVSEQQVAAMIKVCQRRGGFVDARTLLQVPCP